MVATDTNGHSAHATGAAGPDSPSPHPLDPLIAHLAQLRQQASLYAEATADRFKLSARQAAIYAALGCLALLAGGALVVTSAVLILNGTAGGLAVLLGGRLWAGQLITGVVLLVAIAAGAWLGVRSLTGSSRRKTIEKYERRHIELSCGHETPTRHGRPL
jgi:hypothetical protein